MFKKKQLELLLWPVRSLEVVTPICTKRKEKMLNKLQSNNFSNIYQRIKVPGKIDVLEMEGTDRWIQRIGAC